MGHKRSNKTFRSPNRVVLCVVWQIVVCAELLHQLFQRWLSLVTFFPDFFCLRKMCVCVWTNLSSSSGLPNFIDLHKAGWEIDYDSPSNIQNQQHTFLFSFLCTPTTCVHRIMSSLIIFTKRVIWCTLFCKMLLLPPKNAYCKKSVDVKLLLTPVS